MKRRTFVAGATATGMSLASGAAGWRRRMPARRRRRKGSMTQTDVQSGYAPVNGLQMYYEIHGTGGVPLLVLTAPSATRGCSAVSWCRRWPTQPGDRHGPAGARAHRRHRPAVDVVQMADDTAASLSTSGSSRSTSSATAMAASRARSGDPASRAGAQAAFAGTNITNDDLAPGHLRFHGRHDAGDAPRRIADHVRGGGAAAGGLASPGRKGQAA